MNRLELSPSLKIIFIFLICALAVTSIGWGVSALDQEVVATVNGKKITQEQLYNRLVEQGGFDALNYLIAEEIIAQEVAKAKIQITEEELQKEKEVYYEYYGGKEIFEQFMTASGYSLDTFDKQMKLNAQLKKLMEPRISISEEEMQDYFNENKDFLASKAQVKASHILVDNIETAQNIKKQLDGEADFAQLAKEFSIDEMTKESGGDLGFFGTGEMVKEFEDAAFSLAPGTISDPVKTDYGYHIIRVEEKIEAKEADYEENKEKIREDIFNDKMQSEYPAWLQEMYEQYDIDILLNM